jgi:hypothetical protein
MVSDVTAAGRAKAEKLLEEGKIEGEKLKAQSSAIAMELKNEGEAKLKNWWSSASSSVAAAIPSLSTPPSPPSPTVGSNNSNTNNTNSSKPKSETGPSKE